MLRPPSTPIPGLGEDIDDLFEKAVEEIIQYDRASASLIQRRLSIGYARAVRLLDQLETAGVVGPAEGSKAREVLTHSWDESVKIVGKSPETEEEDVFKVPENYGVPKDLKLSWVDKPAWGKQLSEVIKAKDYQDSKTEFPFPLGHDEEGKLHIVSLLDVKNLLLAGNPLSQKENLIDSILLTYLLRYTPQQLRLVLNDPTHYLDLYNGIPHLLSPVINDYEKEVSALRWSLSEMDRRMRTFAEAGVRDISSFNEMAGFDALPRILLVTFLTLVDIENTDALILLTGNGAKSGIHNLIVVDRTSGKSLPSNIKSNVPARVVFRLSSTGESKAIDVSGAEKLEPGETLYKPNYGATVKLDAVFTLEVNVKEVVEAVKQTSTND